MSQQICEFVILIHKGDMRKMAIVFLNAPYSSVHLLHDINYNVLYSVKIQSFL